jgi:hypothetical protein
MVASAPKKRANNSLKCSFLFFHPPHGRGQLAFPFDKTFFSTFDLCFLHGDLPSTFGSLQQIRWKWSELGKADAFRQTNDDSLLKILKNEANLNLEMLSFHQLPFLQFRPLCHLMRLFG